KPSSPNPPPPPPPEPQSRALSVGSRSSSRIGHSFVVCLPQQCLRSASVAQSKSSSRIWVRIAEPPQIRHMPGMADAQPRQRRRVAGLPLPDCVALVLQGGGALGSFQAGVIEALGEAHIEVD